MHGCSGWRDGTLGWVCGLLSYAFIFGTGRGAWLDTEFAFKQRSAGMIDTHRANSIPHCRVIVHETAISILMERVMAKETLCKSDRSAEPSLSGTELDQ